MKHLDLLATQEDLSKLQRQLAAELAMVSFSDNGKEKVRDVVREFYTNLIEYAYPDASDASTSELLGDDLAAYATNLPASAEASIWPTNAMENPDANASSETDSNVLRPVCIDYSVRTGRVSLRFADRGVPFNLLEYTPPMADADDDEQADSERADDADEMENAESCVSFSNVFAGGLGIELIRSLTDELTYRYENGWNLVDLVILDT